MKSKIIPIGNSRGIRIPKLLLEESGIANEVEIYAEKGEIRIVPARKTEPESTDTALLSEGTLAKDWLRPDEDEAWGNL